MPAITTVAGVDAVSAHELAVVQLSVTVSAEPEAVTPVSVVAHDPPIPVVVTVGLVGTAKGNVTTTFPAVPAVTAPDAEGVNPAVHVAVVAPARSVVDANVTEVVAVAALAIVAVPSIAIATATAPTANLFPRFMGLNRDGPPRPTAE